MSSLRRVFAAYAIIAVSNAFSPTAVRAQAGPIFDLQPGITVTEFVSVPEETPSNTAFSLRFSTSLPTSLKWLTPVAGAVFFPYGTTENSIRNTDAPSLFAGNIFPLLHENRTAGWLSIDVPLLVVHAPAAGSTGNIRDYGRDIVILPTIYLHAGSRMMREFGSVWSRLRVVVQFEQVLTPNRDVTSGARDRFNPTVTFGMSLSVGAPRN